MNLLEKNILIQNKKDSQLYVLKPTSYDFLSQNYIDFLTNFKYPFFNNFIGYSKHFFSSNNKKEEEEERNLYLIFEYEPNGNLDTYLRHKQIDNATKQIILIGVSRPL